MFAYLIFNHFEIDYVVWEFGKKLLPLFITVEVMICVILILLKRSLKRSNERTHEKTNHQRAIYNSAHSVR
jgi:hypothetical protein